MPKPTAPRHRVALLGFSEFERRTLGSCFRLAGARRTAYVLTPRVDTADFLLADADHKPSVEVVRVTERIGVCVFIGTTPPEDALNWMPRPIDPLRVMRELDALVSMAAEPAAPAHEGGSASAVTPGPAGMQGPSQELLQNPLRAPAHEPSPEQQGVDAGLPQSPATPPEPEIETTPAAFNLLPEPVAGARSVVGSVRFPVEDSLSSPPAAPGSSPLLQADWQPETLPGWEPEWPVGWSGAPGRGLPLFVPAEDLSAALGADITAEPSAGTSAANADEDPAAFPPQPQPPEARLKAPMQAWVDAPMHLRQPPRMPDSGVVAAMPRLPSAPHRPTALVVDDSQVAARFLQRRLESFGLEVSCAENSAEALALFEANAYELVFLDVELGPHSGLDGLALCQRMRQSAAAVESSVVLVSAHHTEVDRARGLLAGCDAYLGKPLQADELEQLLAHHGIRAA